MKDKLSLLSTAHPDCHNNARQGEHHRSSSLSKFDMTNLKSQHRVGGDTIPDINPDVDRQVPIEHLFRGSHRGPCSSYSSYSSDTSVKSVSPCTMYAGPSTTPARNTPSVPPSVVSDGGNQFSPDHWIISPEERALMTNSAHFARDRRRRRGAIQLEAPLESPLPSPSSLTSFTAPRSRVVSPGSPPPASPFAPPYSPVPEPSQDDHNADDAPPTTPDANKTPPRGRLQRSFAPSERENAGPAILPGLLRRLGRPFSGPWRGPSSPLASVSLADSSSKGSLSHLRRMFSRRRRG